MSLEVDVNEELRDWVSGDYELGDVIVFISFTVDGTLVIDAETIRLPADFRFQDPSEALVAASLRPQYHPRIPDWPELTASWRSCASIRAPKAPQLVAFAHQLEVETRGTSRFVPTRQPVAP